MKLFIKIIESHSVSGSNTKMIYKDEQGRLFLGRRMNFTHEETIIIEASDKLQKDGYYHIIKVIGRVQE